MVIKTGYYAILPDLFFIDNFHGLITGSNKHIDQPEKFR